VKRTLALVLIVGGLWPAAPASAQDAPSYDGACTDNAGVTVVVDFQDLGGGVNIRCAPGDVTTGLDALDKAGISWSGTVRFPGFVCRIAGQPGPDDEPCVNTPPATAYWTYWVAPRGGAWCFSSLGAGNRKPPPGTVEGWSFAKNRAASKIPAPGYDPPPPPEGLAAPPLNASDCPAAASPTTTTTVAATTPPPAPVSTSEPPAATTTPVAAPATTGSTPAITATTTPGTSPISPGASTTAAAVAPSDASASSTTTSVGPTTTTSIASNTGTTTRSLGAVDLTNGGKRGGGVSAFTVLAVVVMLGLVAAAVVSARRRRAAPS
jgi:hypothetical protein